MLAFWKEKKVLLTGHTGFKGTWMSAMLEYLGADVCGYSLPLSEYSFYNAVSPKIHRHIEGDISDETKVKMDVESFRPEIILHFASHSSLDGSMKIPDFILRTNLMGVVNVLEAARKTESVKSVVIVTSDKCYLPTGADSPYSEGCQLGGTDPYSTSKVCQELLTSCYMNTFFQNEEARLLGIATARASNVIGAGDYNITRLMPYLLDSFLNGSEPLIRNVHAIRPWQYVLDVLYGYLLLAEKLYVESDSGLYNGAYNFGPNDDGFQEVGYVAETVGKFFGMTYRTEGSQKIDRLKSETKILKLDSTKAKEKLGWIIRRSFEETIRCTVDFAKRMKQGEMASDLCREQIREYCEEFV